MINLISTESPQLKFTLRFKREMLMPSMPSNWETHFTTGTSSFSRIPDNNFWSKDTRTLFSYFILLVDGLRMMMFHLIPEWDSTRLSWTTELSKTSILFLPSGPLQCTTLDPLKSSGTLHQEHIAESLTSLLVVTQLDLSTQKMLPRIATMFGTDRSCLFMLRIWWTTLRFAHSR